MPALPFAKLDIVLGRVRKTVGGKLMFNWGSGFQCPVPSSGLGRSTKGLVPAPVPGHQHVLLVSVVLPVWLVLPHVYYACAFPQDLKTVHTPEVENTFNFYVDFYFKYVRLNALEFTHHVLSRLL